LLTLTTGILYKTVNGMSGIKRIDFRQQDWPFNLLKGNQSITHMDAGQEIEIVGDDPDVIKNLILIIERIPGYYFSYHETHDSYRLRIKKEW